jgi:tetratricopeptide (TPR) repeat protein
MKTKQPPTTAARLAAHQSETVIAPLIAAAAGPTAVRVRQAREQLEIGLRLMAGDHPERAIDRFQRAVRLDPLQVDALTALGVLEGRLGRLPAAAETLGRAVGLAPERPDARRALGLVLEALGRESDAVPHLEAATRLDPEDSDAHARLGRIRLRQGDTPGGVSSLRAAAGCARDRSMAAVYAIRADLHAGDVASAEARAGAAIADGTAGAEGRHLLGQILAERGRTAEALTLFEEAVALDPRRTEAWLGIATNRRFGADDGELVDRMTRGLERTDLSAAQRQTLHFALGKAHDDRGSYETAMTHFDAANAIRGGGRRLDRAAAERWAARIIETSPPGFLESGPAVGTDSVTPILIVGLPRSGTTLAEQTLARHPDVSPGGELEFWPQAMRRGAEVFGPGADQAAARRLSSDYLAALGEAGGVAPRVTDKSPFNFAGLGVIHQLFPQAKIVHCRRNPIDTCLSMYFTEFGSLWGFVSHKEDLAFYFGLYSRIMSHWREVLPAGSLFELDYEAHVGDPEVVGRALLSACGLSEEHGRSPRDPSARRIASASLWQARQPIYHRSVARWRNYEPWLGALGSLRA